MKMLLEKARIERPGFDKDLCFASDATSIPRLKRLPESMCKLSADVPRQESPSCASRASRASVSLLYKRNPSTSLY